MSTPTPQPQMNRIFASTPQPQNRIFAYTPQGKSLYFTSIQNNIWMGLIKKIDQKQFLNYSIVIPILEFKNMFFGLKKLGERGGALKNGNFWVKQEDSLHEMGTEILLS